MRVSELAKELGYKAAELVELAKHKNISIADARAELNARVTAAVRAAVPHRSKLAGTPLMEVYARVVADETARAAAKAAEPKTERVKREPPAEGAEAKPKRVTKRKVEEPKKEPAGAEAPVSKDAKEVKEAKPPAKAPPSPKKLKVVQEFRLSDAQKAAPVKPAEHKHVELSPEEQEALKKAAATPLIEVDKVIGAEKELHAMRP
ncbi:MAG TPA: hypothetical protein VEN81_13075, partial [Planctomycetota bacterium]|nr:hypothetical protein [Planctomycetota bacterium]